MIKPKHISESEEVAELIKDVNKDLYRRQIERKNLENQWKLNLNFIQGNQYIQLKDANVFEAGKKYNWEENKVYNHMGSLMEIRQSKLIANKPTVAVVPASGDSKDVATARTCSLICQSLWYKNKLSKLISRAVSWSETCGTVFYKVTWDSEQGDLLIKEKDKAVYGGDICIDVISPFEIYPQSINFEDLADNESIIHARAYTLTKIKDLYGIDVQKENVDVFGFKKDCLDFSINATNFEEPYALVIERYELPTKTMPDGRLTIVCGDYLCYDGILPYINAGKNKRGYPFIRQVSNPVTGSFFGASVIQRALALQQDYNALKNRKMEFLNRVTMGVVVAEDGSIDVENLEEEGLEPGKIIVYRQGSNPPSYMQSNSVPLDFDKEETLIQNEFNTITGVSDLLKQRTLNSSNISGVALQLLLEQENSRLSPSFESLNDAVCEIASQCLRLYKQFVEYPRVLKIVGEKGTFDAVCFSSSDITSDEVVIDSQYQTVTTMAQKRNMIYEMLSSGILEDEQGKINNSVRKKIIDMLGFGIYDMNSDEDSLQTNYAQNENLNFSKGVNCCVHEIDNHEIHIKEHTCLLLGAESENLKKSKMYNKVLEHIREHKKYLKLTKSLGDE